MAAGSVEELSSSLIREFLSRKGLKGTLSKLDEELPRCAESIGNRAQLAKAVKVDKLMKRNKELPTPYRTIIEVIVNELTNAHLTKPERVHTYGKPITSEESSRTSSVAAIEHRRISVSDLTESESVKTPDETPSESMASTRHSPIQSGRGVLLSGRVEGHAVTGAEGNLHGSNPRGIPTPGLDMVQERSKLKGVTGESSAGYERLITGGRSKVGPSTPHQPASWGHLVSTKTITVLPESRPPRRVATASGTTSGLTSTSGLSRGAAPVAPLSSQGAVPVSTSPHYPTWENSLVQKASPSVSLSLGTVPTPNALQNIGPSQKTTGPPHLSAPQLVCEDLEGLDLSVDVPRVPRHDTGRVVRRDFPQGKPIQADQAKALRQILFGDVSVGFNAEWRRQNLVFTDTEGLEYGLVQHKGGPCGTLASLQAHVLKHLLFEDTIRREGGKSPRPTVKERNEALVSAIAEILWRAGGCNSATVALCSSGAKSLLPRGGYRPHDITDQLSLVTFERKQLMILFLEENLVQFMSESSCGCIMFTVSVILTRGIAQVQSDMDEPSCHLIGAHGYCTQELVNLILTGRASSNVFDGVVNLDSGAKQKNLLKGIHQRSDIGFLSLFEHYRSCEVGRHYKFPRFPIFVVCSESHFLVLYNTTKTLLEQQELQRCFDLFYYDGLANQREPIRLTIRMEERGKAIPDSDLTPPIELCIKTRWRDSVIDWNGSELLL